MRNWLTKAVLSAASRLSEEAEGFALGRGLQLSLLREMQIGVWSAPGDKAPDEIFRKYHRGNGESREGWLCIPYWSPRGLLVGCEFRTWGIGVEKEVRDYRLPESKWVPAFIGLTPSTLQKIWEGGDVWLVEGVFDMALQHAVPDKDVVLACGTARVSRLQLSFLQRFLSPQAMVHCAFDMDETGRKQINGFEDEETHRWIPGVPDRLERVGVRSRAVAYPGGKDPGEIWEKGGRSALQRAFGLLPRGT